MPSPALAEALAAVGDRWTLLLIAALLEGPLRFGELQERLPGIAPNVLSQRLRHLQQNLEHGPGDSEDDLAASRPGPEVNTLSRAPLPAIDSLPVL